ncbi:hypothetical protein HGRIS_002903 [Hohenbuehelia grisea]|uniref:DUF6699 domain-containing protein n=1 Tax=Hohenbuehelia grisea TaxID=104357 RepID=A0ABR3JNA1_9AGAR
MNNRHVTFAASDELYTYPRTPPSTSSSSSSLPSSPGPLTPPTINKYAYGTRPLPILNAPLDAPAPGGVYTANQALALYTAAAIDLAIDPFVTKLPPSLNAATLALPATHPALPKLLVQCRHLPWELTIEPSSQKQPFVTVGDFLKKLYEQLCMPVTAQELERVPADKRRAIRDAHRRRCKEVRGAKDVERRVDFLMEHRRFAGLSPPDDSGVAWRLSAKRPT